MQKMQIAVPGKGDITLELRFDGEILNVWGNNFTEKGGFRTFNCEIPYELYKALEREIIANGIGQCVLDGKLILKGEGK